MFQQANEYLALPIEYLALLIEYLAKMMFRTPFEEMTGLLYFCTRTKIFIET